MSCPKLKPCPFCGGNACTACYATDDNEGREFAAECENVDCLMSIHGARSRAEAAEKWNMRAAQYELNPCPFCGGEAYIYEFKDDDTGEHDYTVNCKFCGAQSIRDVNRQAVIDRWNRRAV